MPVVLPCRRCAVVAAKLLYSSAAVVNALYPGSQCSLRSLARQFSNAVVGAVDRAAEDCCSLQQRSCCTLFMHRARFARTAAVLAGCLFLSCFIACLPLAGSSPLACLPLAGSSFTTPVCFGLLLSLLLIGLFLPWQL